MRQKEKAFKDKNDVICDKNEAFRDEDESFVSGGMRENRSPKGNMWSAIPVALLCMIVNWSGRKQGSGLKGTKSCRTQGDFHSSCLKKWMRCSRLN